MHTYIQWEGGDFQWEGGDFVNVYTGRAGICNVYSGRAGTL